ncbi:hypothetical protein LWI28_026823 [Acer negundo]|uniref:Uncharacterized protein n=1 Tax=Acer negundo TaxID=4023 RepID=A0AAD5IHE0_ACENE|nr:hypothetical protein LWI28_026823 [Acer negundo]
MLMAKDLSASAEHVRELREAAIVTPTKSKSRASEQQSTDAATPSSVPTAPIPAVPDQWERRLGELIIVVDVLREEDEGGSERHFGYRSWWKESNLKGQVNDMQNLEPNKRIMGKGATFNALSGKLLSKDISAVGMTSAAKASINEGEERCNLMDVEPKPGQAGVIGPSVANQITRPIELSEELSVANPIIKPNVQ